MFFCLLAILIIFARTTKLLAVRASENVGGASKNVDYTITFMNSQIQMVILYSKTGFKCSF